ncbi:hypothetical protein [Bacillus sp. FJAT-27245]|uniref:hypothetical protein n=1 Tax=Bacillus sp. FJAT-27245 TaxID=1684144 RepID=UPI0006A7E9FC|nr:hypothetical protein [Bacillus sp. FJAT-27245]
MRGKRILYTWITIASLMLLLVSLAKVHGTQADQTTYYVDISTSPANGFLIAKNMAPGDKKTSILNVSNNGNLDFNYSVSSRQESGDQALFNKIQLTVSDGQGRLFQGPLSGLSQFALGTIAISEGRTLTFTAELPIETGNEAQGKSTSVAFDFTAIAHEDQIPMDGCFEPPFSNRQYTMHQKSTTPIKFHLRDPLGNLDTEMRQNVKLVISGPSIKSPTGTYIFKVSDGTLEFQNKVEEPHYHARFSTWDYMVMNDGSYSAKVYLGEKVVCQRDFQVLENGNRSNAP